MKEQIQQKVIDGAVKAVTAALTGSGIVSFSNNWIGERTFASYCSRLNEKARVLFAGEPPGEELLRGWSERILTEALDGLNAAIFFVVAGLLLLVGHVVFRGNLRDDEPANGAGGPALQRHYRRFHPVVTLGVFLLLGGLLSSATSRPLMVTAFVLLVLPGTLYLVLYSADLQRPRFATRFTWIACALLIFSAFYSLPRLYGQRLFDVELVQVQKGDETFFAFRDAPGVLCSVQQEGGVVALRIVRDDGRWDLTGDPPLQLSSLVEFTEKPALSDAAAEDLAASLPL